MKTSTLLLLTSLVLPSLSFASTHTTKALVRTERNQPEIQNVILTDLISSDSFDGEFFKVVQGKSETAVRFDASEELVLRAATTYYHLTRAHTYFAQKLNSEYVQKMGKITVRIDHKNQFSEVGHFANDALEPQFNNALTVPAGNGSNAYVRHGGKPWGLEIWFRPVKKINIKELRTNNLQAAEMNVLLENFRNQVHMQSLQRFLTNVIVSWTDETSTENPFSQESLIRAVGASVIMEVGYRSVDPLNRALSRHWYWLDTAMVPEIIYHEYAHAALSDYLVLSHSTAVIEGMADFFAGQIANSPKLADKIKKYNTYNGKNAKRKQDYMIQFEMTEFANTDFVFGLLWEMKNIVGAEKGEAFMFELRKKITTNSSIRGQLVEGLLDTCEEVCAVPFNDRLRILRALDHKGI